MLGLPTLLLAVLAVPSLAGWCWDFKSTTCEAACRVPPLRREPCAGAARCEVLVTSGTTLALGSRGCAHPPACSATEVVGPFRCTSCGEPRQCVCDGDGCNSAAALRELGAALGWTLVGEGVPPYMEQLFGSDALLDVRLDFDPYTLDTIGNYAKTFVPCRVTVAGTVVEKAGCRTKGASSLREAQTDWCKGVSNVRWPWKVDLNVYDADGDLLGLTKFVLNAAAKDPSVGLREWAAYKLYAEVGQPAPATRFVRLLVNGQDLGLHLLVEAVDRWGFLERELVVNRSAATLYKPEQLSCRSGRWLSDTEGVQNGLLPARGLQKSSPKRLQGPPQGDGGPPQGPPQGGGKGPPPDQQSSRGDSWESWDEADLAKCVPRGAARTDSVCRSSGGRGGKGRARRLSCEQTASSVAEKGDAHGPFAALLAALDGSSSAEAVLPFLDAEQVLTYLATTAVLAEYDSIAGGMAHNLYLLDRMGDGTFSIISWDHNEAFGGFPGCSCRTLAAYSSANIWDSCGSGQPITEHLLAEPSPLRDTYYRAVRAAAAALPTVAELAAQAERVRAAVPAPSLPGFEASLNPGVAEVDGSPGLAYFLQVRGEAMLRQVAALEEGSPLATAYSGTCEYLDPTLFGGVQARSSGGKGAPPSSTLYCPEGWPRPTAAPASESAAALALLAFALG